jgi:succinate dehydrogenase/fumarate reductase flavoprotein subunit
MTVQRVIETDILVIGAGMAGMFAAIKAKERGMDVTLTDKGYAGKAGGTHFSDGDYLFFRPERGHNLKDCVDAVSVRCEYLNNRDWEEICLIESEDRCNDLVSWGVPFYQKDGKPYYFALFNPPGVPPVYEDIAMVNREYAPALRKKAIESGVRVMDRMMFGELLKQDGRVVGAIGFHTTSGKLWIFHSKAVVLATGSSGLKSGSYPIDFWTGDGEAMAYRAGAEIASEEFGFGAGHVPADLKALEKNAREKGTSGETIDATGRFPWFVGGGFTGAWFGPNLNAEGTPITKTIWEAHSGRAPLYQDMSLSFKTWNPERLEWLRVFFDRMGTEQQDKLGVDVFSGGKIQWPASRINAISIFCATGIWPVDKSCATGVPGLYAAGNCCATMVSGAGYAGMGFALNHAAVTGTRAGLGAVAYASKFNASRIAEENLKKAKALVTESLDRKGGFSPRWLTQVLQGITVPYFILNMKHGDRLQAALTLVEFLNSHLVPKLSAKDAHEWRLAHETRNMVLIAEMRLRASLYRTESRGTHLREDYPRREDPEWLAWVKIKEHQGQMHLYKEPVPEKWWPDMSLSYEERYPLPLAMG